MALVSIGGAGLNVSLAAYLMNANNGSYFGPGEHWNDAGWDTVFDDFPQLTRPVETKTALSFCMAIPAPRTPKGIIGIKENGEA